MKITMVTASYRGGGAEQVQITLAKSFHDRGHEVSFLSFEDYGELRQSLPQQIPAKCLNTKQVSRGLLPFAKYLRKENPDVIVVAMIYVGISAILAKTIAGWKGKIVIRADSSAIYSRKNSNFLLRMTMDFSQKNLLPRAHAVIGVSTAIANEYRNLFKLNNCVVINNPVPVSNAPIQTSLVHPFFQENKPVILAIGRLHQVKGFNFLLESFANLRKTIKAKLIILGEGEERCALEKRIVELGIINHVSLPGYEPHPETYLHNTAIFAISSLSEAFGLSLVEAMAIGVPVVCTDSEGPQEILNGGELGALVQYGDIRGFSKALEEALTLPDNTCEERKDRAMDFRPSLIASQYEDMIKKEKIKSQF